MIEVWLGLKMLDSWMNKTSKILRFCLSNLTAKTLSTIHSDFPTPTATNNGPVAPYKPPCIWCLAVSWSGSAVEIKFILVTYLHIFFWYVNSVW
jgi:hypothetical protein